MKQLATFISIIFHPILIPLYGIFILFNVGLYIGYVLSPESKQLIYLMIAINTIVLPGSMLLLLRYRNVVSSLQIEDRKQRFLPFLMMLVFYYVTYYLFNEFRLPVILTAFIYGACVSVLVLLILNMKWKVSAHMVGIGGLLGMIYSICEFFLDQPHAYLIYISLIAGFVAYARLKLNAHKPKEVYLGLLVGFLSVYLTVVLHLPN